MGGESAFAARTNRDAPKAESGRWLRRKMEPGCGHYRRPTRKHDALRFLKRTPRTRGFRWFAGETEKAEAPANRHCTIAPMNGRRDRTSC